MTPSVKKLRKESSSPSSISAEEGLSKSNPYSDLVNALEDNIMDRIAFNKKLESSTLTTKTT